MELLEDDDNEEDPYHKITDRYILLSSLYEKFTEYKIRQGILENDNTKNLMDFEKKIMAKMEITITECKTKHKDKPMSVKEEQINKNHRPKVQKTRMGKVIVMCSSTISHINSIVKQKCLNAENELTLTELEYEDNALDLDEIYDAYDNNDMDFLDEDTP